MTIFKEQVQVGIVGGQVNGGIHALRHLSAEEHGWQVFEFPRTSCVLPDGISIRIKHVKVLAIRIESESGNPLPAELGLGERDRHRVVQPAIEQVPVLIHRHDAGVRGIAHRQGLDIDQRTDGGCVIRPRVTTEVRIHFISLAGHVSANHATARSIQQVQVGIGGSHMGDLHATTQRSNNRRAKTQAQDTIQVVEGGLGFLAQGVRIVGDLVLFSIIKIKDRTVPGPAHIGRVGLATRQGSLCVCLVIILLVLSSFPIGRVNHPGNDDDDERDGNCQEQHGRIAPFGFNFLLGQQLR